MNRIKEWKQNYIAKFMLIVFLVLYGFSSTLKANICDTPFTYDKVIENLSTNEAQPLDVFDGLIKQRGVDFKLDEQSIIGFTKALPKKSKEEINKYSMSINKYYCGPADPNIRITGSDTIGEELMPLLAVGYLENSKLVNQGYKYIRIEVDNMKEGKQYLIKGVESDNSSYYIKIKSEGTSYGLIEKNKDILMSSRELTKTEISNNDDEFSPEIIGTDQIKIIVNRLNPYAYSDSEISLKDLRELFKNPTKGWTILRKQRKEIKPDITSHGNKQVVICSRDEKSGTYSDFVNLTGIKITFEIIDKDNKKVVQEGVKPLPGHKEVAQCVADNITGIGYVPTPFIGNSKDITVLDDNNTIQDMTRNLYLYHSKNNSNYDTNQFIDFIMHEKGQALVKQAGFIPVGDVESSEIERKSQTEWCTETFPGTAKLLDTLNFETGLDTPINALSFNYKKELEQKDTIVILGWTDSLPGTDNLRLSQRRADSAKNELTNLFKTQSIRTPNLNSVGCGVRKFGNDTVLGREKNRVAKIYRIGR